MRVHSMLVTVVVIISLCLFACSSGKSVVAENDRNRNTVDVIALLPVENHTADARVSKMLRTRLNDELRFKGYPQIAPDLIDRKLLSVTEGKELNGNIIPPKAVEELLGADAVMYCSLDESKASITLFYAPATVSVRCELRSAKTGETLWNAQYKSTNRSFSLFRSRLKMKSHGDLEAALEEAVDKMMETLPFGPKLRG